jgi:hypothetical protein
MTTNHTIVYELTKKKHTVCTSIRLGSHECNQLHQFEKIIIIIIIINKKKENEKEKTVASRVLPEPQVRKYNYLSLLTVAFAGYSSSYY